MATTPSLVITSYSSGNLYFTISGTGITPPTLTTGFQLEYSARLTVVSNGYQYIDTDTTSARFIWMGTFNNA